MSSKKIYIIRHGQTDFNFQNIVQGSGINSSLNEKGKEQAEAFFEMYGKVPFDKVYLSALRRTAETVQPFISSGIPSEILPGLNEISWGIREGTRITTEENEYYHQMLKEWQLGNTSLRIDDGESPEDVVIRMKPAIDHIMAQTSEQRVLICMHGRAMRILLCMLLNQPLKSMDTFEHQNLCLYLLDYDNSTFTAELRNDIRHLRS